jgi:hypothetical protein
MKQNVIQLRLNRQSSPPLHTKQPISSAEGAVLYPNFTIIFNAVLKMAERLEVTNQVTVAKSNTLL